MEAWIADNLQSIVIWSLVCCFIGVLIGRSTMRKEVNRFRDKLKDWRARGYFNVDKNVVVTLDDIDALLRGE